MGEKDAHIGHANLVFGAPTELVKHHLDKLHLTTGDLTKKDQVICKEDVRKLRAPHTQGNRTPISTMD